MMNNTCVFVTGANGEVGHGLIQKLAKDFKVIGLDISDLDENLQSKVSVFYKGSVTDKGLIEKIFSENKVEVIFHLAAILSTGGEKNPELAHTVNVGGTFNILSIANKIADRQNRVIKFVFPSTIAVYGLPDINAKNKFKKVKEYEFLNPITIYGINKLYCENLGKYFSTYYMLLSEPGGSAPHQRCSCTGGPSRRLSTLRARGPQGPEAGYNRLIDFRCLRFPGLISADTIPTGGTSDYAPEMIHNACQGKPYRCFVRPDSTIPFLAMPDAIKALVLLTESPKSKLTRSVYSVSGFSVSAKEIEKVVKKNFPGSKISYKVNEPRQKIIDSWPQDVDDSNARKDWGWKPEYSFEKAFNDYLIPSIKRKYNGY